MFRIISKLQGSCRSCTTPSAPSAKITAIGDSGFFGIMVVRGAAATFRESAFLVKAARGGVGFADFEEDGSRALGASSAEKLVEQAGSEAATASGAGDSDIFDLPLQGDDAGNEKALNGFLVFNDQGDTGLGGGEDRLVLPGGPVGSGSGMPLQRHEGRNIVESGRAEIHAPIFGRSLLATLCKNLVGAPEIVGIQRFWRDGLAGVNLLPAQARNGVAARPEDLFDFETGGAGKVGDGFVGS
jgi:hypothetical protein